MPDHHLNPYIGIAEANARIADIERELAAQHTLRQARVARHRRRWRLARWSMRPLLGLRGDSRFPDARGGPGAP
jgi:hypothetical protein